MSAEVPPVPSRKRTRRLPRGFSLIELMLVVVIIGILSTFAFPYYQKMTARARRTEMQVMLQKLHVYFVNVFENNGSFDPVPGTAFISAFNPPNDSGPATGQYALWQPSRNGWQQYTFPPDGSVRMRYQYSTNGVIGPGATITFNVEGDFPGFGPHQGSTSGNYTYTETLTGPVVSSALEVPAF